MTLSKMILLTLLEAKSILRHKALFPNKDLKVRVGFFGDGIVKFKGASFSESSSPIVTGGLSDFLNLFLALLGEALHEKEVRRVGFL